MRVGLYDCDLVPTGKNGLSIDLLKLAGEYREKNDIYSFLPSLTNLDLYTKIHYWCDINKHFLSNDLLRSNLMPGGKNFGIKIPKEIEDINYNTNLYQKWFEKFGDKRKTYNARIKSLLKGNHLRLARDENILNYGKHINPTNKLMYIHDDNIFSIKNWTDIFDEISEIKTASFGFRYPVIIQNIEDNENLDKYRLSDSFCKRYFDLNVNKEQLLSFANVYHENAAKSAFMISPPTFGSNREKVQYIREIVSKVIFCQSKFKYFSLTYSDNLFFGEEFRYFLLLLLEWRKSSIMLNANHKFSFMSYLTNDYSIDWAAVTYIFDLDPEIKRLCVMNPNNVNEEIIYESVRN